MPVAESLDAEARQKLRSRGRSNVAWGLALFVVTWIAVVACAGLMSSETWRGVLALSIFIRMVAIVVFGVGLADLAEAKGHSRRNGRWALLFVGGLLAVALLPDLYASGEDAPKRKSIFSNLLSIGYSEPTTQDNQPSVAAASSEAE